MKPITLWVQGIPWEPTHRLLRQLAATELVRTAMLLVPPGSAIPDNVNGIAIIPIPTQNPGSTSTWKVMLEQLETPWFLQVEGGGTLDLQPRGLQRLLEAAESSGSPMVYGDYLERRTEGRLLHHPLPDYQLGSVGDDFPFGPLRLGSHAALDKAISTMGPPDRTRLFHAPYELRLRMSTLGLPLRLPEVLATWEAPDARASGARVFDYLTATRNIQVEAEQVLTAWLDATGAKVHPPFRAFTSTAEFPVEATVAIPVRNRVKTVGDAVKSALSQRAAFPYNVIVVDNHSDDGTPQLLLREAARDPRLLVLRPERNDLGIGGCWNEAVFHPRCGRYVVQLDSDDIYQSENTLSRMVELLRGGCGLAIGAYSTVNMALEPIPPGLIDHREWTDENGPNNALRVGGMGAPRAFATELVRQHPFPNVSYGEDYAVALRLAREYRVGRLYDPVYWCRRWEGNSDADLSPETSARYRVVKDRFRTLEILGRRSSR